MSFIHRALVMIRWILGVLFVLVAISSWAHPIAAIANLLIATVLIPPTMRYVENKAGRNFARWQKILAVVVLVVIAGAALPDAPTKEEVATDKDQAQTQDLQKQHTSQIESIQPSSEEEQPKEESADPKAEETNPSPAPTEAAGLITTPAPKTETPKTEAPKVEAPKAVTTPPKTSCDPNYSGCVPIASDVDCKNGTGDGPAYTGYTTVIGRDIYGLDRDGDGIACDK